MRTSKRIALGLLGTIALIAAALAYTAQTRYVLPPASDPQDGAEFSPAVARRPGERTVVLFVFDGFAPSTVRAADTPSLDRIVREGAHTLDMMPVFPSLSLPNHFSLSTGCYPERHGVVSNHFMDPKRGVFALKGDADWLLACEPLHVAAERQGIRSAVFGSVAATSSRRGRLASIAEPHRNPPPDARMQADRIIAQLKRPAGERPGLITAYVDEPDGTSHYDGPEGPKTLAVAREIDGQIGRVMDAITRLGLREKVTLIVTTDHGMLLTEKIVSVERLLRKAEIEATVLAEGSIAHLYLAERASKRRAAEALARYSFLDVIDPDRPPAYARLGKSERVGDLVVSVHRGHYTFDSAYWPWYLRWRTWVGEAVVPYQRVKAIHGYDPESVPEMRAIFYAWGHEIVPGAEAVGMRAVDVHPTIAHLLSIEAGKPVDGSARMAIIARAPAAVVAP